MSLHDAYRSSISSQWFHWYAFTFWVFVCLGSIIWSFLGGGRLPDLVALVSGAWCVYNLYTIYRLQKALREYREALAKTQDVLSKTTIG